MLLTLNTVVKFVIKVAQQVPVRTDLETSVWFN